MKILYAGEVDLDTENKFIPSDFYYSDLTGDWDSNRDGLYGEPGKDNIDLYPEINVGRIPFDNEAEIKIVLLKTRIFMDQSYEENKKKILFLGAFWHFKYEDDKWSADGDSGYLNNKIYELYLKYKGFLRKNLNELEGLYPTNVKNITDAQVNQNNLIKFVNEFQPGIVSWMGHGNWDGTARKIWAVDYDNNGYPTSNEIKWDYFISNNMVDKFNIKNPSIISWYFPNLTYESFENNPSMYSINAMFLSYLSSKISVSESVNKTFVWYYERFWNQSEYLNKNIAHNIYCLNLFGEPIISLDSFTEKVSNPRVISTYPSNNQSDVPTNVEIVVKFDRNIDKRTVTSTNFILQEGTKIIQGNLNYNEKDFSIVFKPLTELKKGTLYNVTIKKEIKDNFGNTLQGDLNFHLKQFHKLSILLLFFMIKMKVIK